MALPLSGIRVLSLEKLLPAPFCTRILCDLGASITRVVDPRFPDMVSTLPPFTGPKGPSFLHAGLNYGKRDLVGQLDDASFRASLLSSLCDYDVLVINMKPGAFESLFSITSLDSVRQTYNPRLIVCFLTAYSLAESPWQGLPGHDLNCVARAGLLRVPTAGPAMTSTFIADYFCAWSAATRVLAALFQLRTSDPQAHGMVLDCSMLQGAATALFLHNCVSWNVGKNGDQALAALHGAWPNYEIYECADSQFVAIGCLEPEFWARFLRVMMFDSTHLPKSLQSFVADPKRALEVRNELQRLLKTCSAQEVEKRCASAKVPVDRILSPSESWSAHKQVYEELGMVRRVNVNGKELVFPVACPFPVTSLPVQSKL
eukprot:ANDGO_08035.mRNA.1 Isopenicillin N epimerase component 2